MFKKNPDVTLAQVGNAYRESVIQSMACIEHLTAVAMDPLSEVDREAVETVCALLRVKAGLSVGQHSEAMKTHRNRGNDQKDRLTEKQSNFVNLRD